jgi:predicted transcriptional regulator
MDTNQIERARALKGEGQSLRRIAAILKVAPTTVSRALKAPATGEFSTLEKIRQQRLIRLTHQNAKLALEVRKLKAQVVDGDQMRREVLNCNVTVKTQFLSLGPRMAPQLAPITEPREIAKLLTDEVTSICNDLAYERERPVETCPTCGRGMKDEEDKPL